ncbi:MAG: asparaginase [Actinomycetota bacterium]
MSEPAVLARVTRSGLEESIHLGHVVVCDTEGALVASAGDPDRVFFVRSSLKPVQAAVSVAAWGDELGDDDVAIMCGSHNGEAVHVDAVRRLLARAGLGEDALRCPAAWPRFPEDAAAAAAPRPVFHNCSGKHAGMLGACVANGWSLDGYLEPAHPLQARIRDETAVLTGTEPLAEGVDGCGAPVFAAPVHGMATMFARLAEGGGPMGASLRRATAAMRRRPDLVAGRDRLDTAVMQAVDDVVVKSGAEGLVCAGVLGRGLGIAVRVEDGSSRATGPALVRTLHALEIARDEQVARLERFAGPEILGGGRRVGSVTSDFTLSFR